MYSLIDKLNPRAYHWYQSSSSIDLERLELARIQASFHQREVNRKLRREQMEVDQRLRDLKLNGGIRLRRIPIKLIYHKARFKKRKRRLMREKRDPSVTQKLEIPTNSLRLGVKSGNEETIPSEEDNSSGEACPSLYELGNVLRLSKF
ncbi:hypothetical protein DY000_02009245 [Brassica cretica]|uniref:Uncharacterized protein n=1 Tax=Brassica cretica TaxID=69181 RepID=A0ABQ7CKB8_BRACR|nr:hypothetical protein DY000_02009245 [Brassica cretica]